MIKVAVIMSTYNGERFLCEQIESIMNQQGVDVTLYIRDDGSTDKTLDIISNYCKCFPIFLTKGTNIGVGNSFMELLYAIPDSYDYYCFSDQDDIWLENKLIAAIEKLKTKNFPCLYTSNQILIDKNGHPLGKRYKKCPSTCYKQIINQNFFSGCTMVWNKELFILLRDEKRRPSPELLNSRIHDVWVALIASVIGEIIYDEQGYILYRQHEHNVVGVRKTGLKDYIHNLVKKLRTPHLRNGRSNICKEVYTNYYEYLNTKKETLYTWGYYDCHIKLKYRLLKDSELREFAQDSLPALILKIFSNLF